MNSLHARNCVYWECLSVLVVLLFLPAIVSAQNQFGVHEGNGLPRSVNEISERGAAYLASQQKANGAWSGESDKANAGVTALATMALLATGEDPNFGKFAPNVRAGLRFIIRRQDPKTGFIKDSMYEHGFSTLVLSEAYGAVDEDLLWSDAQPDTNKSNQKRTIAESLKLAVQLAVQSQAQNRLKSWRYLPKAKDADVSIAGAIMIGLLAARNAGIAVPDQAIADGLKYLQSQTVLDSGTVSYSGPASLEIPLARASIVCLVHSLAKHQNAPAYKATKKYVVEHSSTAETKWPFYEQYYQSQALFQADYVAWQSWNKNAIQTIRESQSSDGRIGKSPHGSAYSTSMSLLALALNHRFLPIYER